MGYTTATPERPGGLFIGNKQDPSGKALIVRRHQLSSEFRDEIKHRLGQILSQRKEVGFACIHGSFLEPAVGFRDIDVGIWANPSSVPPERALDYEEELSAWLEHYLLSYTPLMLKSSTILPWGSGMLPAAELCYSPEILIYGISSGRGPG
jgi:hypothetical protein